MTAEQTISEVKADIAIIESALDEIRHREGEEIALIKASLARSCWKLYKLLAELEKGIA